MFCGQRIVKQGATVTVHQDLCVEDLHEALVLKVKDSDALVGPDLTEYEAPLGSSIGYSPEHSSTLATISPTVLQQQPVQPSWM